MKKKTFAAALLSAVMLMSGCSLLSGNKEALKLPPNPRSHDQIYDEDTGDTTIKVNGKTYSYYGRLNGKISNDSIRECLGYVGGDKDTRIYTLYEDPYDNYIMVKHVNGIMDQPEFLRATDTRQKDIFTPAYIKPAGYECWGSSGMHYEMPAASVGFTIIAENIKLINYAVSINGEPAFFGQTGIVSGRSLAKNDHNILEINEFEAGDKADKDKPFKVSLTFSVVDMNGTEYEVEGSYVREMMFGAYLDGLEIREDGGRYYLFEDV